MPNQLPEFDRPPLDEVVLGVQFEPLEKFYTTLQSQAPYDTRILEGLKALYEAGGEQAKLADIQVSLNILSSNVSEAQGGFSDYEEGVADADFAAEGLPGVTEIDFPWEEEIELTVPGDESDNDGGEQLFIAKSVEESRPEKHFPDSSPLDLEETLLEIEFDEESTDQKAEGESAPFELVLEVDNDTISDEGKYAMDGVFNEFEKVPDQQIEREDTETHFNLGIAYKEMGLYDIAIKEFIAAAVDPLRTADCLILQGICLREQGDLHRAEEVLLSGVERYDHEPGKSLNLRYELGLLYEASGRNDDALRAFRDVFGANPGFRDTVGKIARLHGIGDLLDLSDIDEVDIELEGIK